MTLKQVFDDLSDGILIVNHDGDISYFNQKASSLISGETVDTLGLATLQRMMQLILSGELSCPIRFAERPAPSIEYSVKIINLYSYYVVQFVEVKRPKNYQNLKHSAIRMIEDKLGRKLQLLSGNLESLLTYYHDDRKSAAPGLIMNTIDLIGNLSLSISELEHLSELYLEDPLHSYSRVAPVTLLRSALNQVKGNCQRKNISVKIRKKRSSVAKFYCNATWVKMAMTECLLKVIDDADNHSTILLKMDLHGHFLSIIIENTSAIQSNQDADDNVTWIDYPMGTRTHLNHIEYSVNFDLSLAERVISLHGGSLKMTHSDWEHKFIIELPVGYQPGIDTSLTEEQLNIYAQDLAKLQANQSKTKKLAHIHETD